MTTARRRNGHSYSGSASHINQKAQLANAYQELGQELGSEKVKCVGGYTVGRVIGEGTYGSVHLATHRLTGTRCAIKKIPKSACSALTREIHHHRKLHHASILHLHEIIATESHIWLVTELCSGGELFDYLVERGRLLEGEARRVFGELCLAVGWMHARGTVHRDLKLENVFLDGELKVKLGDLGFAREWQRGNLMDTFCGTTGYASPEMLAGRKYLGQETDVWSLGIILYTLLCGGLPFDDDDEETMKTLIAKGEYEEPEWLSEEARDLIRGMLKQQPSERLSMESIFTHPWFMCTIYDNSTTQVSSTHEPATSIPPSPMLLPPSPSHRGFVEPFQSPGAGPSYFNLSSTSPFPSPLAQGYVAPPSTSAHTSETSDASFDFHEDDRGGVSSGVTTPTTAEGDDEMDKGTPLPDSDKAKLGFLHANESQSTIRRSGTESPKSAAGSILRGKSSAMPSLADQTEEDEDVVEEMAKRNSVTFPADTDFDEHALHLPLALHSRTPSRTKRRSVSSTMSLERRHSAQNTTSSQWLPLPPVDFLAQLNEPSKPFMTTPLEKQLLTSLSMLGFDTGQLVHSVLNDACDASSALWWILRGKQLERGETDEALAAQQAAGARRRERKRKDSKENADRDGRRRESPSEQRGPDVFNAPRVMSPATSTLQIPPDYRPPGSPARSIPELGPPLDRPVWSEESRKGSMVSTTSASSLSSPTSTMVPLLGAPESSVGDWARPRTPPNHVHVLPVIVASPASPAGSSPKKRPENKARSASVSMLQRATSAFGVHVGARKSEEKVFVEDVDDEVSKDDKGKGRLSPSKLTKAPSLFKMTKDKDVESQASSRNVTAKSTPAGSPQQTKADLMQATGSLTNRPELDSNNSSLSVAESSGTIGSQAKVSRKDSLLTTVRGWFNEDRRKRKRNILPSPLAGGTVNGTALIASRGIGSRQSHGYGLMSRRTSLDATRPGMVSRRSSSVNSRRSSITEMHRPSHIDLGIGGPSYEPMLHRRQSDRSHRSGGSRTPTSERDYPSRPSSVHSFHRGSASRPGIHGRSPSQNSQNSGKRQVTQSAHAHSISPLHNYHRRATSGGSSTRVRHVRAIHESHLRSGSMASNRSGNSSRHSSFDRGDLPLDFGELDGDDASIRSWKRRSREGRSGRSRSPSSSHHIPKLGAKPKAPLRDVFHNHNKTDDDWESEDDEQAGNSYAGGVGQGSSSTKKSTAPPRSSMSMHPAASGRDSPVTKRGLLGAPTYRERMGVGVPEEEEAEEGEEKGDDGEAMQNRGRGQLPVRGGGAPFRSTVIQEEEEEEE